MKISIYTKHLSALLESLFFPTILFSFGLYFHPTDPFFIGSPFPLFWFAPILVALRYGSFFGLFSFALGVGAIFFLSQTTHIEHPNTPLFILWGGLLTVICGHNRDMWFKKANLLQQQTNYFRERFKSLSMECSVLRISHSRLEQSLITKPITLRDALIALKKFLQDSQGTLTQETAERFLQLLVHYASFNSGGLFLSRGAGIDINPVAQIGTASPLLLEDPLVQYTLKSRQTCCFAANSLGPNVKSEYLVVAPLLSSNNTLIGLLTISDMPFLKLNAETLQMISILLAYFADEMLASKQGSSLQQQYPDCSASFAFELHKAERLWRDIKVDSGMVAYYLSPHVERNKVVFELLSNRRILDQVWQTQIDHREVLVFLMPVANYIVVKGHLDRTLKIIERFAPDCLENGGIKVRDWLLSAYPNTLELLKVVKNEVSV